MLQSSEDTHTLTLVDCFPQDLLAKGHLALIDTENTGAGRLKGFAGLLTHLTGRETEAIIGKPKLKFN